MLTEGYPPTAIAYRDGLSWWRLNTQSISRLKNIIHQAQNIFTKNYIGYYSEDNPIISNLKGSLLLRSFPKRKINTQFLVSFFWKTICRPGDNNPRVLSWVQFHWIQVDKSVLQISISCTFYLVHFHIFLCKTTKMCIIGFFLPTCQLNRPII